MTGLLAFAFGIAAVVFPTNIMFGRILDVILGRALLALVVLVASNGLLNLFGAGMMSQRATRLRGVLGIAVAIAATFAGYDRIRCRDRFVNQNWALPRIWCKLMRFWQQGDQFRE